MNVLPYSPRTNKLIFSADFETTPASQYLIDKETRVWIWYTKSLYTMDRTLGLNIEEFINYVRTFDVETITYFHNMSGFDGEFIIWALKDKLTYIDNSKNPDNLDNCWYRYKGKQNDIYYILMWHNGIKHEFRCSLKLIPVGIEALAPFTPFNSKSKFGYDYNKHHYEKSFSEVEIKEVNYLINDVDILWYILREVDTLIGLDKLTIASMAYDNWSMQNYPKGFRNMKWLDRSISFKENTKLHKYYQGAINLLNPKYKGISIYDKIYVKDVNGLYSWAMLNWNAKPNPIKCDADFLKCKHFSLYDVYIKKAKIKDGHIPYLLKPGISKGKPLSEITSPLMYNWTHYDLKSFIMYHDFEKTDVVAEKKQCYMLGYEWFNTYIGFWNNIKATTPRDNWLYLFAKLMLNALYGKFGTKLNRPIKLFSKEKPIPYTITDPITKITKTINTKFRDYEGWYEYNEVLTDEEYEEKYKPKNIKFKPIAIFITAKARYYTLKYIQLNRDGFIYADTDSIHSLAPIDTDGRDDDRKLGFWKSEGIEHNDGIYYLGGRYLNKKQYVLIEEYDDLMVPQIKVKVCGMSKANHNMIEWHNFWYHHKFEGGKLIKGCVKGGVILVPTDFTVIPTEY